MTDGPSTDDPTLQDPPPPPPPGDPAPRIPLRRSHTDRVIAGVAGGVARHFGIDPVIIRLAFVVLALLGGSGLLLYLIAWLVIPREGESESAAMDALRGGERPGGRSLLAIALLIGAILLLSGSLVWWPTSGLGDGLFLPLLILAAGVALLVWPTDGYEWHRNWHADNDDWRNERAAIRSEWRKERDAWRDSRREWRHGYRRGFSADDPTAPTPPPGVPGGPPPPPPPTAPGPRPTRPHHPRRPRPTPFLGPLGVALLLLYAGAAVFAERVGWVSADIGVFLAGALVIIGVVLVVSAFFGRARGLIWLGVWLLPFAWFLSSVELVWWSGIGEELIVVDSLDELEDEYRWGIGEFHLDLTDLDLGGETRELAVGLTIGELKVFLPPELETEIDLEGGIGQITIRDGNATLRDEGVNLDLFRRAGEPDDTDTLELEIDIGIGAAEILVCNGTGGTSCP